MGVFGGGCRIRLGLFGGGGVSSCTVAVYGVVNFQGGSERLEPINGGIWGGEGGGGGMEGYGRGRSGREGGALRDLTQICSHRAPQNPPLYHPIPPQHLLPQSPPPPDPSDSSPRCCTPHPDPHTTPPPPNLPPPITIQPHTTLYRVQSLGALPKPFVPPIQPHTGPPT